MNECKLGGITESPPDGTGLACNCDDSCEPHAHTSWGVECWHDGETDHAHCPQAPDFMKELSGGRNA